MTALPKLPIVASAVAFLISGVSLLVALRGRITFVLFALIPLAAGIGILRKRAWSAYGLALFQAAQLLLIPLILFRSGAGTTWKSALLVNLALAILFFQAGRALRAAGAEQGRALPWIAVSLFCTVPLFFFQPFVIPTGAMEDTLLVGDCILVQRVPKIAPRRGDIVAFINPVGRKQTLVKRAIGIPGDRIRISQRIVYRNGAPLTEPYTTHKFPYDAFRDNLPSEPNRYMQVQPSRTDMLAKHVVNGEVVVPDGKYFVLGDNRDNSFDSRYWGFIGIGDVIGRLFLIYDSEEPVADGAARGQWNGLKRVRWGRIFKLL